MASEAINNLINNPDLLSDPSVLLLAGAATVSVIALTCYCLPKKSEKKEIKEEQVEEKTKPKEKVQDSKKSKKESKVKPEKKIISVDHPLWISSTSTGGILSGFAYNVITFLYFSLFFVIL